jgi:hypothetical protein
MPTIALFVVEQHRRQRLAHVPFHVIRQHRPEDGRAHAVWQTMTLGELLAKPCLRLLRQLREHQISLGVVPK